MKPYILISLLSTLLLASACQKSGDPQNIGSATELISFESQVLPRGAATTTDNITDFGVFCYYTDSLRWATAIAKATAKANKLCNTKVSKGGDNTWTYTNPIKWSNMDDLPVGLGVFFNFFAYSPYIAPDAPDKKGVVINTTVASVGAPTLTYTQPSEIANHIDLLVAKPRLDMMHVGSRVPMIFRHALANICFSAAIFDAQAGYTYNVEQIAMLYNRDNGEIYRKATLDMNTHTWSGFDAPVASSSTESVPMSMVNLNTTYQEVSSLSSRLFYIPQVLLSDAIKLTIKVTRTKTSTNEKSSTSFSDISIPDTNWQSEKRYNYQYSINFASKTLALHSVLVSDWTTSSGGSIDIN